MRAVFSPLLLLAALVSGEEYDYSVRWFNKDAPADICDGEAEFILEEVEMRGDYLLVRMGIMPEWVPSSAGSLGRKLQSRELGCTGSPECNECIMGNFLCEALLGCHCIRRQRKLVTSDVSLTDDQLLEGESSLKTACEIGLGEMRSKVSSACADAIEGATCVAMMKPAL